MAREARERERGGNATAEALIRSARKLFSERGYDGASVRAMTAGAGANLGAVTYHFGSKRRLYEAVLARVLSPVAEAVAEAAGGAGSALDRIEAVVRALFAFLARSPDLGPLLLRELVARGGKPPRSAVRVFRANLEVLVGLVREGQAEGSIRDGDPVLMAVSIVSQPIYLTVARRVVRAAAGLDPEEEATRRRVVEHAVRFVREGLAGLGEGGARGTGPERAQARGCRRREGKLRKGRSENGARIGKAPLRG